MAEPPGPAAPDPAAPDPAAPDPAAPDPAAPDPAAPDPAAPDPAALDPAPLLRLGNAFAASRVLLTAVELDLFTLLETPRTAAHIRDALHLHPRAVPDFPDALVALRVLQRRGAGRDAVYANTPAAAAFLARRSPTYLGGFLEMNASRLYRYWAHLTDGLRTGAIQNEANPRNGGGGSMWDGLYRTPQKLEAFVAAMAAQGTPAHAAFARRFDFSDKATLLDVGGASAQLSCEVAARNPHMRCRSLDFPAVSAIAERNIRAQDLHQRVSPVSADMWTDDFGTADVITMSFVLHDYSLEKKKALLTKAYHALPQHGAFVAIEMLIDDDRRTSVHGLIMSLNMIIETEGGFDYTASEFAVWAKDVGFTRCQRLDLVDPVHAVIAFK